MTTDRVIICRFIDKDTGEIFYSQKSEYMSIESMNKYILSVQRSVIRGISKSFRRFIVEIDIDFPVTYLELLEKDIWKDVY